MTEQPIPGQTGAKRKKTVRALLLSGAVFLFLLMSLVIALQSLLPSLVEHKVNEILAGFMERGQGGFRIVIREIGLARTTFAIVPAEQGFAVRHGDEDFGIGSISLFYSPRGLLAKSHIDAIRIEDVRLPVQMHGNVFHLPLMEKFRKNTTEKTAQEKTEPFRLNDLPVTVGRFELAGIVRLGVRRTAETPAHDEIILPVSIRIVSVAGNWDRLAIRARISGSVNTIAAAAEFDTRRNHVTGRITGVFDTRTMPYALREYSEKFGQGKADFSTVFDFDLNTMKLKSAEGTLRAEIQADVSSLQIDCRPLLSFSVEQNQLRLTLEELGLSSAGRKFRIPRAETNIDLGRMSAEGSIRFRVDDCAETLLPYSMKKSGDGTWHLSLPELKIDPEQWKSIPLGGLTLTCGIPEFSAQADYAGGGMPVFKLKAAVKDIELRHPDWSAHVGEAALEAEGNTHSDIVSNVILKGLRGTFGKIQAEFPEVLCDAGFISSKLQVSLLAKDGVCELPDQQLRLSRIRFSQTAQPLSELESPGDFSIEKILLQNQDLGSVTGKTVIRGQTLCGNASAALCGIHAEGKFSAGLDGNGFALAAELDVPEQKIPENLADIFPEQIGDKKISGLVKLSGAYAIKDGRQSGNARISLKDGAVSSESMKLDVSGIHAEAEFPNLPELRTAPDQKLFVRSLQYNTIKADSAVIRFRLDSAHSICLERLGLNWCGGKIRMECTYLDTESDLLSVTIHCDRLDLLEFLTQVGAGQGQGNGGGRISGTMPVRYNRKTCSVNVHDAFLYSTPGEEGKIEFVLSDAIRESQIKSTAFDMTQDALRNFLYSWAKVQMKTEGESLKLQLQLNGKPAAPLYYSYDSTGLVKSKVPHTFQGILLDVNIDLPFEFLIGLFNDFNSMNK